MNELKKLYYSIGEVSALTDLPASVLRYWETEFSSLRPPKNRAGKRIYRPADIERLLLIKKLLYEERFTIEGACKHLKELKSAADPGIKLDRPKSCLKADDLRRELKEILDILAR
jgi:DNA-binding transcriptional MerR regulator